MALSLRAAVKQMSAILIFVSGMLCSYAHAQIDKLTFANIEVGYGSKGDFLYLNRGNPLARAVAGKVDSTGGDRELLLHPKQDLVIALEQGRLRIGRGAIVYTVDNGTSIEIFDLSDSSSGSVVYEDGKRVLELRPGKMVLLAHESAHADSLISLPHRRVRVVSSDRNWCEMESEFSLYSAIADFHLLKELRASQEVSSKKLFGQIMKIAAVEQTVFGGHGAYSPSQRKLSVAAPRTALLPGS